MNDNISRSELIAQLESYKAATGDVVIRVIVDRIIGIVKEQPPKLLRPQVEFDPIRRALRLLWPDGSVEVIT